MRTTEQMLVPINYRGPQIGNHCSIIYLFIQKLDIPPYHVMCNWYSKDASARQWFEYLSPYDNVTFWRLPKGEEIAKIKLYF